MYHERITKFFAELEGLMKSPECKFWQLLTTVPSMIIDVRTIRYGFPDKNRSSGGSESPRSKHAPSFAKSLVKDDSKDLMFVKSDNLVYNLFLIFPF